MFILEKWIISHETISRDNFNTQDSLGKNVQIFL